MLVLCHIAAFKIHCVSYTMIKGRIGADGMACKRS